MTETARPLTTNVDEGRREPEPWWQSPFRMFQTNLREPDALMDVDATLDQIEEHGADVWLVNAGGIISFYPSQLPFQSVNPYLRQRPSGDLLADAVAAARRRGIRVMARIDFSKVTAAVAKQHPEWWYIDPSGEPQVYQGLTSMCPLGAYYQQRAFDVIDEVIARYGVDGFFFNWFSFNEVDYSGRYRGVCHCRSCHSRFAAETDGLELPDSPQHPHYDRWLGFASTALNELSAAFRAHVAAADPGAALILGQSADIVFHEANNAIGRELWPFRTAASVSAHKSLSPEKPVLVNAVSFIDMPYRLAGEQAEHFGVYLVQAIARGAVPSTYIMGAPGDIDYPNLPVAGEVTRFHRDNNDVYEHLEQHGDVALVYPDRLRLTGSAHQSATEEFRGLYLALQEKQRSFDVIAAEDIPAIEAAGSLTHAAVLLPDIGALSDAQVEALERYLHSGGTVLSTGSSAIADSGAVQISGPATTVTETIDDRERLRNSYVGDVHADEDVSTAQSARMVPVTGVLRLFNWQGAAARHGHYVTAAPLGPPEKTYGHRVTAHPGWAELPVGDGTSIRIPFTPGRTYRETSLQVVRDHVLRTLEGRRRTGVVVQTAEQVEVITSRSAGRTVVHLINMSGLRRQGYGPALPIFGTRLHLDDVPTAVVSRRTGERLAVEFDGTGRASALLPELREFDVVVIEHTKENRE
ncbi:MAG TPA: beta-galactosidase [Candidatus Agrococcus pullicola]|uniref:Beta-galactosidase n=1 Tax=Candidatus Agrococcus pullicola TaxID=2838429 RepID=A0A9D1YSA2_9MICO|nr:beta-galactosidase [Candidatus Agrococcus pullicola]